MFHEKFERGPKAVGQVTAAAAAEMLTLYCLHLLQWSIPSPDCCAVEQCLNLCLGLQDEGVPSRLLHKEVTPGSAAGGLRACSTRRAGSSHGDGQATNCKPCSALTDSMMQAPSMGRALVSVMQQYRQRAHRRSLQALAVDCSPVTPWLLRVSALQRWPLCSVWSPGCY